MPKKVKKPGMALPACVRARVRARDPPKTLLHKAFLGVLLLLSDRVWKLELPWGRVVVRLPQFHSPLLPSKRVSQPAGCEQGVPFEKGTLHPA